ncbi:glycosyltransferase family 39 protein [Ornithinimicrobium sp. F0845]|uniref:glycosyltransferase family 39 protein n=1 Tax=Ornithinimicrobium sp. F0845 TaxID=2926412 RepID=UPI001FF3D462|nr:glycosyltransferase family 39 protein [Ornithinimicrobium sp. F0845]MCK0113969.1 glycosyltransferase family 39 protein [Ornithinimicrobium sp. F0845]
MPETEERRVRPPAAVVPPPLRRFAWVPVLAAAGAAMVALTAFSGLYGYHRDELYFRMLPAEVGYTDQPFLTPWLARTFAAVVADEVWTLRIPATLAAGAAVVLLALLTRELGGGRRAQVIAAWGYAGTASVLMFGHVLLPATLDLALWLGVLVTATRAALRDPRWWLVAGALVGLTTWNRWLVVVLALAIAVGVLLLGPRQVWSSPWAWGGVVASLAVAGPNLLHQAANDWPQLAMGAALSESNAGEVRLLMWPLLFLLLGPALVPTCLAGVRYLWTDPAVRHARFLLVCLGVLLAFTFIGGTQPHYFMTPLAAVFAAGCVRLGARTESYRERAVPFGLNTALCALIGLPLIPLAVLGSTPLPAISPLAADQVGWSAHVATVASTYDRAVQEYGEPVAVITANYGEAGAVARYGPEHGLPAPVSGHNHLHSLGGPDADVATVVMIGQDRLATLFQDCAVAAELDNGVGVDNEEQGVAVRICHGPRESWDLLWPRFAHLD